MNWIANYSGEGATTGDNGPGECVAPRDIEFYNSRAFIPCGSNPEGALPALKILDGVTRAETQVICFASAAEAIQDLAID
jgi:hypothetical protein